MFTRTFGAGGGYSEDPGMPPPLHTYDTEAIRANWHPLERPAIRPTPPGPVMVMIPQPAGAALGDDPTDPAAQTRPRFRCEGMIGWLNDPQGRSTR